MLSFLGGLASKLVIWLLSVFGIYRAGESAQASKDTTATLATVEREQIAESKAPKTKQAEIDRLKAGTG